MSGIFSSGDSPETDAMEASTRIETKEGGFDTDVPDIKAPSMHNNLPVFEVSDDEFYANMRNDRKRLNFKDKESLISKYLHQSQYNRPFYLKTQDNKMRKVG